MLVLLKRRPLSDNKGLSRFVYKLSKKGLQVLSAQDLKTNPGGDTISALSGKRAPGMVDEELLRRFGTNKSLLNK